MCDEYLDCLPGRLDTKYDNKCLSLPMQYIKCHHPHIGHIPPYGSVTLCGVKTPWFMYSLCAETPGQMVTVGEGQGGYISSGYLMYVW